MFSRRAALWVALISGVCMTSTSSVYALQQQFELRVTGSRVNVRSQPTTSSDVLFQVSQGQSLELVEEVGNWYLVETEAAKRGYVFEQLVELVKLAPGLGSEMARPEPAPEPSVISMEEEEIPELEPLDEASVEEPSRPATPLEEAREKSLAQKQKKRGLYKMIGGAAGMVTGIAVMGSSKPAGVGLLGAGGFFVWNGYRDKREAERRLQWGLVVQLDRDTRALAYHMSW